MKKLNSKLFKTKAIKSQDLSYLVGGVWVQTCFGSSNLDRVNEETSAKCDDFQYSQVSTKADWNWLGSVSSKTTEIASYARAESLSYY